MTDPVTSAGRDDVLASIRRLVLEDAPARPLPGRLVLTPALRVPAPPVPMEDAAEAPGGATPPLREEAAEAPLVLLDPILPEPAPVREEPAPPPDHRAAAAPLAEGLTASDEGRSRHGAGEAVPAGHGAAPAALGAIDDARLRALLADVVREELQGELGERITRNIRRLVRREILRALEEDREG